MKSKQAYKDLFKGLFFASASFLFFFYFAMCFSVKGYTLQPYYMLINFIFVFFILFSIIALPGPKWLYLSLCYVALFLPTVIVSSYIHIYKSHFNFNLFFFIWDTNLGETSEFAKGSLALFPLLPYWVAACALLPLGAFVYLGRRLQPVLHISWKKRGLVFLSSATLLSSIVFFAQIFDFNYIIRLYHSFFQYRTQISWVLQISKSNKERILHDDIRSLQPKNEEETYVILIGESASRHHMGIYGYPRGTSPNMQKTISEGKAFAFNNVIATIPGTLHSLLAAFSFIRQGSDIRDYNYSAIDIFNGAGFKTFWFSNNAVLPHWDTMLGTLSKNALDRRFSQATNANITSMGVSGKEAINTSELTYDDVLLPWFREALQDPFPKKAIFLHLKGSHIDYEYRYPPAFRYFKTTEEIVRNFPLDEQQRQTINHYDNSIYYTDHIWQEILDILKSQKGSSWLLYFSDHGEEVYDFRDFRGRTHDVMSKYVVDVPLVLWLSEDYKKNRSACVFDEYLDRPYRLDDLIHSLMDLAYIETRYLDRSRSIFSDQYQMHPRVVIDTFYLSMPPRDLYNPRTYREEMILDEKLLKDEADL